MKLIKIVIAIMAVGLLSIGRSNGQVIDSTRHRQITYFRNLLQTDSTTAKRVMQIQFKYKQSLKALLNQEGLNEQQKRKAIDSLMVEKNRQLEELLPEEQRNKLIPTTERRRTWKRDTTSRSN